MAIVDQLGDDVAAAAMSAKVAQPQLEALIRSFMRHYAGAADRQKVLSHALNSLPPDKRRAIVQEQRRIIDAVQRMIVALHPALGSDPARARVQTVLVLGMINWIHTWFDLKGALSLRGGGRNGSRFGATQRQSRLGSGAFRVARALSIALDMPPLTKTV